MMANFWRIVLFSCLLIELGTSASLSSFDDDLFGTNDDFDYQQNEASFDELVERYDKMYSGNDITEPSITDKDANANGTRDGARDVAITANLTSIVDDLAEILSNEESTTEAIAAEIVAAEFATESSDIAAAVPREPMERLTELSVDIVEGVERAAGTVTAEADAIDALEATTASVVAEQNVSERLVTEERRFSGEITTEPAIHSSPEAQAPALTNAEPTSDAGTTLSVSSTAAPTPTYETSTTGAPAITEHSFVSTSTEASRQTTVYSFRVNYEVTRNNHNDFPNHIDPSEESFNNIETHDDKANIDSPTGDDLSYPASSISESVDHIADLELRNKLAEEISNAHDAQFENVEDSGVEEIRIEPLPRVFVSNITTIETIMVGGSVDQNEQAGQSVDANPNSVLDDNLIINEVLDLPNITVSNSNQIVRVAVNENFVPGVPAEESVASTMQPISKDFVVDYIIQSKSKVNEEIEAESHTGALEETPTTMPPELVEKSEQTVDEFVGNTVQIQERTPGVSVEVVPATLATHFTLVEYINKDSHVLEILRPNFEEEFISENTQDTRTSINLRPEAAAEVADFSEVMGATTYAPETEEVVQPEPVVSSTDLPIASVDSVFTTEEPESETTTEFFSSFHSITNIPDMQISEVFGESRGVTEYSIPALPSEQPSAFASGNSLEDLDVSTNSFSSSEVSEIYTTEASSPTTMEAELASVTEIATELPAISSYNVSTTANRDSSEESNENLSNSNESNESVSVNRVNATTPAPVKVPAESDESKDSRENSSSESEEIQSRNAVKSPVVDIFQNSEVLSFSVSDVTTPVANSINAIGKDEDLDNTLMDHTVFKKAGVDKSNYDNDIFSNNDAATSSSSRASAMMVMEEVVSEMIVEQQPKEPATNIIVGNSEATTETNFMTTAVADDILRTIVAAVEISDDISNTINTFQEITEQDSAIPESDSQIIPSKNTRELADLETAIAHEAQNREIEEEPYVSRITVLFSVFSTIGLLVGIALFAIPKMRCTSQNNFSPI